MNSGDSFQEGVNTISSQQAGEPAGSIDDRIKATKLHFLHHISWSFPSFPCCPITALSLALYRSGCPSTSCCSAGGVGSPGWGWLDTANWRPVTKPDTYNYLLIPLKGLCPNSLFSQAMVSIYHVLPVRLSQGLKGEHFRVHHLYLMVWVLKVWILPSSPNPLFSRCPHPLRLHLPKQQLTPHPPVFANDWKCFMFLRPQLLQAPLKHLEQLRQMTWMKLFATHLRNL